MHRHVFTLIAAASLLAVPATAPRAQDPAPPNGTPASTQGGVFTAQQAARGRTVYAGICTACHSTSTHTGAAFFNRWGGRPVVELYALISETMPQMEPGSLSKQEYVDVVAYLLQLNRMPAGQNELPADTALMRRIRIDSAAVEAGQGGPRRRD